MGACMIARTINLKIFFQSSPSKLKKGHKGEKDCKRGKKGGVLTSDKVLEVLEQIYV